jgi:hypothetical protein
VYDDGREVSAEIDAVVWEMKSMDFILGLPDILEHFLDLFVDMLYRARSELLHKIVEVELIDDTDMKQGEEREWTTGVPEVPEEEEESYVPVQYESVLNYMEMSYEEAKEAYLKMLEDHIGPLLAGCQEIRDMLRSDLAMDRYVPKEWSGIKGFPPWDLETREDLPAFHKVRARTINANLIDNAFKEFTRLSKYMFNLECV